MRSALPPLRKIQTDLLMQRAETAGRKGEVDAQPTLREVFSETVDAPGVYVFEQLNRQRPVLWVSDRPRGAKRVICMVGDWTPKLIFAGRCVQDQLMCFGRWKDWCATLGAGRRLGAIRPRLISLHPNGLPLDPEAHAVPG
jgi:protein ImuA